VTEQVSPNGALLDALRFLRDFRFRILAVSAAVVVPCFWHRDIVSSDLGSHLYNAWLAQLIRQGHLPGLWVGQQHTNVFFDYLLSGFGAAFGLHTGEKLAVSLAVLVFFWGSFALVAAAARRAPWFIAPCIALFTYGWTFHLGFFNYYLSLGFAFFALAILWRGSVREWIAVVPLGALCVLGHPLGLVWLAGGGVYVVVAERMPHRAYQLLLSLVAAALLFAAHKYVWAHYNVYSEPDPRSTFTGLDQLYLFGPRYQVVQYALLAFALIALIVDLAFARERRRTWSRYAVPLQLLVLAELGVQLSPGGVHFPPPTAALALVTERLTLIAAVLICCVLGIMRPRKWHLAASGVIAVIFFGLVYRDTAAVLRMEQQVVQLVSQLPPNQRVMGTILRPPDSRVLVQHILDRACIGRCWSYGNYEPSTGLFHVHAAPGNPYVLSSYDDAVDMENGEYTVQPEDLPVYQVYQCDATGEKLCMRALEAGEENDHLGVHPDE